MAPDEIVKALRSYAKNAQENFEVDTMQDFDLAADLIESMQADLRHEEKVSHGQMEQNKRLRKMMDKLQAQLAESLWRERAAVEDLYEACKGSPCNNGICAKKNCTGNHIPCEFEWRGPQEAGKGETE